MDEQMESAVAVRLADVMAEIAAAAREAGRDPHEITLVAVGKGHDAARIRPALEADHRVFGENRVQEAADKWPALVADFPGTALHLIGPLQTNKVRQAVVLFDVIETVDRPKLARELAKEMARAGRRPDCFIQVNTGAEAQKAGVLPGEADSLIKRCRTEFELPVRGLMCIPPVAEEPSLHFALLREIAHRNGLAGLSMGMSADYRVAIAFGATHVRVGTAIFGERPPRHPD
ncbi:MAG: YggS family pyridoxal phosphate-dependent enzyme [Alphaproteobacteria bacterium]|nr:YggS family pyridoxal phosphate-dependent enzyme [Alphaproteobacteria bacterium]